MATQQVQTEQSKKAAPEAQTAIERKESAAIPVRRERASALAERPFSLMRRFSEDMDRLFRDFFGSSLISGERWGSFAEGLWPAIDVYQRDNKLVVQADVPGMEKNDIKVELRDAQLYISGERRSESERSEAGYYRAERSYGSFSRAIPLPADAKPETAAASFDKGVLKVEVELQPQMQPPSRVVEIREIKSN